MSRLILEITVFICGAVVMAFELLGSRVTAPWLGTSLYVWTSIIGVILASLSVGYLWGGKTADLGASRAGLSSIIAASAGFMAAMVPVQEKLLPVAASSGFDLRLVSVATAFIIFAPTSFLLGMVSPYAVRLVLDNVSTSGRVVGRISAISTAGSLAGTFVTGFYLIALVGTLKLQLVLALILVFTAIAVGGKRCGKRTVVMIVITVLLVIFSSINSARAANKGELDIDTAYNRICIREGVKTYETMQGPVQRRIRVLQTDRSGFQSMIDPDNPEDIVYTIAQWFRIADHFRPDARRALTIGGSGYIQPRDFLRRHPEAEIDVVEIDKGTTELARAFFGLKDDPRLRIYEEDGRTFLNNNRKEFDVIFIDAFGASLTIPWQLTTAEAVRNISASLDDKGVVVMNLLSGLKGPVGLFARSLIKTFSSVFPHVILFQISPGYSLEEVQNFILVGLKDKNEPLLISNVPEISSFLSQKVSADPGEEARLLTDDYAPVDNLILPAVASFY